jgi:hypothetical protein
LLPAGRTLYLVFDVMQKAMKGPCVRMTGQCFFYIERGNWLYRQELLLRLYKCIMHLTETDPSRQSSISLEIKLF